MRLGLFAPVLAGTVMAMLSAASGLAQERGVVESNTPPAEFTQDVFIFGGRFHDGYFTQSFTPFNTTWENNYILGGGYQTFFGRWGVMRLGAEVGGAGRFTTDANPGVGDPRSAEVWAGLVGRFDGFDVGLLHITPALTAGFSVVTGLIGVAAQRNAAPHLDPLSHDGRVLYYLGPEVSFSLPQSNANVEFFIRAQHRSGGFGTLAALDGSNADVVGLRYKF